MSVDWPSIKDAIVEFSKLTNVIANDAQIYWEEEAKPNMIGDFLWLAILNERSIGYDDREDVDVSDGLGNFAIASRITGIREFTVEFRFRSRSAKGTRAARNALETIRASLNHPARRKVLDDANVGFLAAEQIRTELFDHDQRKESIAVLPVRFSAFAELYVTDLPDLLERTEAVDATVLHEGQDAGLVYVEIEGG